MTNWIWGWLNTHVIEDIIKNEHIRGKVRVIAIEDKMRKNQLRWFGHVNQRSTDVSVRRCDYETS